MSRLTLLLCLLAAGWCGARAAAQGGADSVRRAAPATPAPAPRPGFVARMQAFAKKSAISSASDFKADKVRLTQDRTFESLKLTMHKAGLYLNKGIDTMGFEAEMATIDRRFALAGDGVFTHRGSEQTFRNLTATSIIVGELLATALERKARLEAHQQVLRTYQYQLDSLLSVPDLFVFPQDSAVLQSYMQKIRAVGTETNPVDDALTHTNHAVRSLLNQTDVQVFKLQAALSEIESYQRTIAGSITAREFPNLWEKAHTTRPFAAILAQAWQKGSLTLLIYAQNNWGKLVLLGLATLAAWVFIRSLRGIHVRDALLNTDFNDQLVLRYPLRSALLLVLNMGQFLFASPPFLFSVLLWLTACGALTSIFWGFIIRYWMRFWLAMVGFFVLATGANLLLQASRGERWFMLLVSLLGATVGTWVFLAGPKERLRERWIRLPIGLLVVLEAGAVVTNVFGRYNLSKSLFISGFLNVVIAILFLWTVRLIDEGLCLASTVYQHPDKKLFFLNFNRVGSRSSRWLYAFLVAGWTILMGRNFPGFAYISEPLKSFLTQERAIGEFSYTIVSVALFIAILTFSVVLSKVVSFFASDRPGSAPTTTTTPPNTATTSGTSPGLGSWVLLIRITVLTLGLLLAFMAAGFPLDRIALVLGALGVGIGFGLQALVNNLVSGLIIAFEKPLNVGDVIEVEGQSGKVKSIGFRSSIITTWDGADVVMPNGDVLNSHLVNWTLGGSRRRLTLVVGVAYGTDLTLAKRLIADILEAHPVVYKLPAPTIVFEQFNTSAIDIRVHFWNRPNMEGNFTKSDLILAISQAFQAHQIVIPFPQQEVYYHLAKDTPTSILNPNGLHP